MDTSTYILSARRTAVGSFRGILGGVPAPRLGAIAITSALEDAQVKPNEVEECIMGNVLTAGLGQAPARQAAIYSGLPNTVPTLTINKVCGSGLKAVMLGADQIQLGYAQIVVAGGQENMSLAPHLLENSRAGVRMGPIEMSDSMIKDGLWDPYSNLHMGSVAELCAGQYSLSRAEQDEFATESYRRAQAAIASGVFSAEIVPVPTGAKEGPTSATVDEEPGKARFDKIPTLRPAFGEKGTITAANASKLNDGGAALILASSEAAKARGLKPLARIVAHASFAHDPKFFTTAPIGAIRRVLERAKLTINDIELFEINEAFSVVALAAIREFNLPHDKVNVNGGAIAIGHPIGASGARLLVTLVHALIARQKRYGLATLCIGGGEAVAMIIENTQLTPRG